MASKTIDRSHEFRTAWIVAFLGLALILGTVFWALIAYGKSV